VEDALLSIQLFSEFRLRFGDEDPVSLESARAESLLTLLVLDRGRPRSRQHLAFRLWPDSTEGQALTNLRHLLHTLRRAVPELERHVEVTPRTLRWSDDETFRLDVAEFEEALARGAWQDAVDAYAGDLLADREEEWLQQERVRLRRRYLEALDRLVAESEHHSDLPAAVRHAERLLREDPLREETYGVLMRLHDARGDRARAVRVYHECAATLERELGVEPAASTRAAYDALLVQEIGAVPRLGGSPLVGRAAERAALTQVWRGAGERAQVVLLTGEPGIGKTRLAEEFRAWCAHRGAVTAMAGAYAGEGALAYGPVVVWLRSEDVGARLPNLARSHLTELARLLPELLAIVPGLPRPERLPESEQRRRLYDAVVRALDSPGRRLLLVADDLQWWDREALQLLQYLVRTHGGPARLVVVGTARREDMGTSPPLQGLLVSLRAAGMLTEIELDPLAPADTALLAERLGGGRLSEADTAALHEQTEGNPLFVVEALRAGWRLGASTLTRRVQAVIESRFAQLSPAARGLVDIAAVVGREFTTELLVEAGRLGEEVVVQGLDELWRRRIIREYDATAYAFSHDRLRESAYAILGPVRRRYLHGQVARALAVVNAGDVDAASGQLAHHYDQAGSVEQAVTAYARAADVAQQLHAHTEAARLLTRALDLLRGLPRTAQRSAHELELSTALLAPLVASQGYASPRIAEAHRRALALTRSLGAEPAPPLLRSLGLGGLARGDFAAARDHGAALRERGERDDDDVLRVEGDYLLGVAAFWAGDLTDAREHLERAVATYREENRLEHLLRYAQDPKVVCLTRLALIYWFLGEPEAAARARDQGLAVAEEIGHPYSLGVGLLFAALLALDMRDLPALRRFVDRARATVPEDAGVQIEGALAALDAYLDLVESPSPEGIARIRRIVAAAPTAHQAAPGLRSALLRILLAACEATGDTLTGLEVAEELMALTSSAVWRPEARRLRAKFLDREHAAKA
jgi:DNA-binding SARP family transcriptional activator